MRAIARRAHQARDDRLLVSARGARPAFPSEPVRAASHSDGAERPSNPARGIAAAGRPRGRWHSSSQLLGFARLRAHARHAGIARHPARQRARQGCADAASGLSRERVAVAFTQIRLALRTPRGRSILAGAAPDLHRVLGADHRSGGISFPGAADRQRAQLWRRSDSSCACSLFLPFAMNQFAIDGAGFTR